MFSIKVATGSAAEGPSREVAAAFLRGVALRRLTQGVGHDVLLKKRTIIEKIGKAADEVLAMSLTN